MNSVNLIGRWVRDNEMTTVGQQGTPLVKNTIAVDHPFKKDSPSFLRVVMWGKTGELANQYTGKGSQIAVEGHLETGSYDDKDGKKVFTVDVVASRIKFLDSKNESSNQSNGSSQSGQTNTQNQQQDAQNRRETTSEDPFSTDGGPVEVADDDLPF
ncbi:single-stranded DNA-binding protein [Sporosarcina sp. FSL K6-1508]|uniref:single-stranded DNA-binding protein n=1 Tax=Sporosarcina sp. FSL K6-1508 TaxID=2921553 RepID=UPI0030FB99A0